MVGSPGKPAGEFKTFIEFMTSRWGVLAAVSVVFPLSNKLIEVIPLEGIETGGGFALLKPALVLTATSIATVFCILAIYSARDPIGKEPPEQVRRNSIRSFFAGAALLVLYVVGYQFKLHTAYEVLGWESEDPRHVLLEAPLSIMYVAAFVLITRGFVLLALLEYLRRPRAAEPSVD